MNTYRCSAPGHSCPSEDIAANTSFEARDIYARRHHISASECIAERKFFFKRWV